MVRISAILFTLRDCSASETGREKETERWLQGRGGGKEKGDFNRPQSNSAFTSSSSRGRKREYGILSRRAFILTVFSSPRIHANCQEPASLITAIDELERVHSTVRKSRLSLSLSLFTTLPPLILSLSLSLSVVSIPGGFQPPILSSNRENWRIVCRAKVASLKSIASADSRRVASRTVTYRARINPRRRAIYPPSLRAPLPSFARTGTFFPPRFRPSDPSRGSMSRISML